jgi:hypothetical protein
MTWAGYMAHMGKKINAYRVSIKKNHDEKTPLARPRCRWEGNIQKMQVGRA